MSIFYDIIYLFITLIYLPRYLFKGKFHKGFSSRLGILPAGLKFDRPIWLHAVSVGETLALKGLVKELKSIYPTKSFVISTVTPTGNKIAKGVITEKDAVIYLPLDFSFIVKKVLNRINPQIFLLAEAEIWPNLISAIHKKGIPIVMVNGRISEKSFRRYSIVKPLIRSLLKKISLFCARTDSDARRLIGLGAAKEKVQITGNMKFDNLPALNLHIEKEAKLLSLQGSQRLLVAGCTHPGEEEIVLRVYKKLKEEFSELRLLLAPRHPKRAQELKNLAKTFGFSSLMTSTLSEGVNQQELSKTVVILDTLGQLILFYALADLVFVGGSFVKKGGHNVIEPASLNKPVIFGPIMYNFHDIAELLTKNNAAIQVRSEQGLFKSLKGLLINPKESERLGNAARQIVLDQRGATQRTVALIKELL